MKTRELTKRIMVIALVASMMLTPVGCNKPTVEPTVLPPEPTPVVYTTQEFKEQAGNRYRYAVMGTEDAYNEAIKGLTPLEGRVLSLTGHQIYQDSVTDTKYIISEVQRVSWSDIDIRNLYEEKTGRRINVVKTVDELSDVAYLNEVVTDVLDRGVTNVELPTTKDINCIFNDRSFYIPNLMMIDEQGTKIAVNQIAKVTGMKDDDQTYNRSGDQYYGISTSMMGGISLQIAIPSTVNKTELVFDEVTGDVFYTCFANMEKSCNYVDVEFLKSKLGWEIQYVEDSRLLVIRTDTVYAQPVIFGVTSTDLKDVSKEEFEAAKNTGSNEEIKSKLQVQVESTNPVPVPVLTPIPTPPVLIDPETGIPDGGNVLPDGSIDNSQVTKPVLPADDGVPKGETPEPTPKPAGGSKIGTPVPGATKKDKRNNLKDGEAMDPMGNYISVDNMYEMCYTNIGGVIYAISMGELNPIGQDVPHETFGSDKMGTGGDWTDGT